jgi:hypothetical protein
VKGRRAQPDSENAPAAESPRPVERLERALCSELERHRSAWRRGERPRLQLLFRDGHSRRLWLARLARAGFGAALGVEARTLDGLARALLERAGTPAASHRRIELEFGRALAESAELDGLVATLEDGREPLWQSLARLLEAGYTPALHEALGAALRSARGSAQAQVVAARTLDLARRLLTRCPGARPPAFLAAELPQLAELLADQRLVLIDPNRQRPSERDLAEALERRAGARALELEPQPPGPRPQRVLRRQAEDPEAEVRLALEFCQQGWAAGIEPERIGLVLYGSDERRAALSISAQRLALPFSAPSLAGLPNPSARRLLALVDLLRGGAEQRLTRLLDGLSAAGIESLCSSGTAALRLGARILGAATIERGADLDLQRLLGDRSSLALPVRLGPLPSSGEGASDGADEPSGEGAAEGAEELAEADQDLDPAEPPEGAAPRPASGALARQHLPRAALEGLRELCAQALEVFGSEARQPLEAQAAVVATFAAEGLGWAADGELWAAFEQATRALRSDLGADFEISGAEWRRALAGELERRAQGPLGGQGAGVQVGGPDLPRVPFDRLAVVGLDRASAERRAPRDAFLAADLAPALRAVLPDLALGPGSEPAARELETFLALADLAPEVLLVCAQRDLDDRERAPSALFGPIADRLGAEPAQAARPAPADLFELAIERAPELEGQDLEAWFAGLAPPNLPAALRRGYARGRAQVHREWSLAPRRGAELGPSPYHGLVGPGPTENLFVTQLESLAKCGWRTFLERRLRLESAPNPEFAWPPIDARLVGVLVHRVLERLVQAERRGPGGEVPRACDEVVKQALLEHGAELAREQGLTLPGLERVLIERAREPLWVALDEVWRDGPLLEPSAEWSGEIEVPDGAGRKHRLHFKADRRDGRDRRVPPGTLLTDYKTGRCFADGKKEQTWRGKLRTGIRRGERLQAVAYARSGGEQAIGRYLFLAPARGQEQPRRVLDVAFDDEQAHQDFLTAAGTLLSAWQLGTLAPRLLAPDLLKEPAACGTCPVREACVQQDSGQRGRFRKMIERLRAGAGSDELSGALLKWFDLAAARVDAPPGGEEPTA